MNAKQFLNRCEVPQLWTSKTQDFREVIPIHSPWHSALILDLIHGTVFDDNDVFVRRNITFLLGSMNRRLEWKFIDHPSYTIDADSDDTVCALIALHKFRVAGIPYEAVSTHLCEYVNEEGLFFTWLNDEPGNEIDVVVNANIYRWFAINGQRLPRVERFLYSFLERPAELLEYARFYNSPIICQYFIVRALMALRPTDLQLLEDRVLGLLMRNGLAASFDNVLHVALTCSILSLIGTDRQTIHRLIDILIRTQDADGHWGAHPVVIVPGFVPGGPYWGASEALTTAFCLEALHLYNRSC